MAKSEARRQKALMKKKRKAKLRKKRQQQSVMNSPVSAKRIIEKARNYPVHECLLNQGWQEGGLAQILLSRLQPNKKIVFGFYLVDVFCLGLKDTYCHANVSFYSYDKELKAGMLQRESWTDCALPLAHQIIYGAIDYAANLGFNVNQGNGYF